LPQIYTDKHGLQLSEVLGDAYLLHSQNPQFFLVFFRGIGLALKRCQ